MSEKQKESPDEVEDILFAARAMVASLPILAEAGKRDDEAWGVFSQMLRACQRLGVVSMKAGGNEQP